MPPRVSWAIRIGLVCAISAVASGQGHPAQGGVVTPEARDAASIDQFGLFIGINSYPRMEGKDLAGAVRDAEGMLALFRDRFGFNDAVLLTDQGATRDGIGQAFGRRWNAAPDCFLSFRGRVYLFRRMARAT
jgi:hypothetical protein